MKPLNLIKACRLMGLGLVLASVPSLGMAQGTAKPAAPKAVAKAVPAKAPAVVDDLPPPSVSAIQMNQTGFLPSGPKRAIVVTDAIDPIAWVLKNGRGEAVAKGQTALFGVNDGSGQAVQQIDASGYTGEGEGFTFSVAGKTSAPFAIRRDLYRQLKADATSFFYHQRAGVAIDANLVGAKWARPAGHVGETATCYGPKDFRGNDWGGCAYRLDVSGGWYDAGDQGKYVVNGGIAVWTLLDAYERSLAKGTTSGFADGTLKIPEKTNKFNDLLDEARYELEFLLRMQVPDDTRLKLPLGNQSKNLKTLTFTEVVADGMAHHKVHDERWTKLPTPPDKDTEIRYLSYPSTAATLNLAAVAAQCGRLYKGVDNAFADRCLTAARKAYSAALRVPDAFAIDVMNGGGGGYGDGDVSDEFYWAATELFLSTGEAQYANDMKSSAHYLASPSGDALGSGDISWGRTQALGTISLSLAASSPADIKEAARQKLIATADAYRTSSETQGYAIPFARPYVWGSNADMLNHGIILGLAYDFTGNSQYRDQAIDTLDYVLGRNPLGKSYVSGYGSNPLRHPHHRFWANGLDPNLPPPPPGVIAGGPQNRGAYDEAIKTIFDNCKPQTCYIDDIGSFSSNEVAINWNAPLVWVAAFADEPVKP